MAVAADFTTDGAPLLCSVIAVPSSAFEAKGEEGTSNVGGSCGGMIGIGM